VIKWPIFARHHTCRLSFFGSVLIDDFGPESDVDALVEFEPGHIPRLAFLSMEKELARFWNIPITLKDAMALDSFLRSLYFPGGPF